MTVLSQSGDDVLIRIRVQPRARANELAGERGDALLVRVTAPPVDGKANAAVVRVLAKALGVPRTRVTVERGASARDKLVRVAGVAVQDLIGRW